MSERLRLYLETTVFNYYFDEDREGHQDVVKLFEAIRSGKYEGYASQYVVQELRAAPEPKRGNMLALIDEYNITALPTTPEVVRLTMLYLGSGIIPASYLFDSAHIAVASFYELDCVVSYNFQHITRDKTKRLTATVNKLEGYKEIKISTAGEVLKDADPNSGY